MTRILHGPSKVAFLIAGIMILTASAAAQTLDFDFDFRNGALGWTSDFSGYPPATNQSGFYALDSGIRYGPRKLTHVPLRAFYAQGNSHSGELIMYLRRRLTASDGIVAGRAYRLEYALKIASPAPTGCVGIGWPPGEGVFIRAGGSQYEPIPRLQKNGWLTLSIDLLTATSDAGNIANPLDCEVSFPYFPFVYIDRSVMHSPVTASPQGDLWLFVGTVSLFEGFTRLYYQNIRVRVVPV